MKYGVAIIGLASLCHAFDGKVKNEIVKGVGAALNYAIFSKSISYLKPEDFNPDGEQFVSITLSPGQSIKYSCGTSEDRKSGRIKMYPEDIRKQTLAPMVSSGFKESVKRVLNNFDVFRSDSTLVYYSSDFFGGKYLIQYPSNSIIVSNNPDFSINIACVLNDEERNENEMTNNADVLYRWLEIKFKDVAPIPYGCGSENKDLFANLLPLGGLSTAEVTRYSPVCEIVPEPGMVVGIYCGSDEKFDGSECFEKGADDGSLLYDPKFVYKRSRLHMFKVPRGGFSGNVSLKCRCLDYRGRPTALLHVVYSNESVCDFKTLLEDSEDKGKKMPGLPCRRDLKPGDSLRIIIPREGSLVKYANFSFTSHFAPGLGKVFSQDLEDNVVKEVPLDSLVAHTGLHVSTAQDHTGSNEDYGKGNHKGEMSYSEYIIRYEKDSVLVLKTEHANLNYNWELRARGCQGASCKDRTVWRNVSIGLIPTDPFTYGCGAKYNHLFHEERVEFRASGGQADVQNGSVGMNGPTVGRMMGSMDHHNAHNDNLASMKRNDAMHSMYKSVECTVDAERMSPVGFYCPKDAILEPEGCFEDVYENGKVVPLTSVAKNVRLVKGKNITGFEYLRMARPEATLNGDQWESRMVKTAKGMKGKGARIVECRCSDKGGRLLASIKVIVP